METWTIVDTYTDGETDVTAYACGCEHVRATRYDALFPCSEAHAVELDKAVAA